MQTMADQVHVDVCGESQQWTECISSKRMLAIRSFGCLFKAFCAWGAVPGAPCVARHRQEILVFSPDILGFSVSLRAAGKLAARTAQAVVAQEPLRGACGASAGRVPSSAPASGAVAFPRGASRSFGPSGFG